jgi:DNA-binding transcriptional LysR family regulator
MYDLAKLVTLVAVVEHGSFSAAGHALRLTQPAVSRQIALLERQVGTQLLQRARGGVRPTEAGRILVGHTAAIVGRLARAEAEIAEVTGLRQGQVRLGSFFTALIYLSAEAAVVLQKRHPDLFRGASRQVIVDELVDRATALARLAAGDLDVAVVYSHGFEPPEPADDDVELVPLFTDPPTALLPAGHRLAGAASVTVADLAGDTWIRPFDGSAARYVDHVLAGSRPVVEFAGHGDEPVEAQAFVAAGHGVTVAHRLNVLIDPDRIAVVPLAGEVPARRIEAAIMRGNRSPLARATVEALREVGVRRGESGNVPVSGDRGRVGVSS